MAASSAWTLDWFYFGDIAYLQIAPFEVREGDCPPPSTVLDSAEPVGKGEPGASGDPPRVARVREVVRNHKLRKPGFAWKQTWPEGLEVLTRAFPQALPTGAGGSIQTRAHDFILGPTRLILPPESGTPAVDLDLKSEYNPATDALGSGMLAAGDLLVAPPTGTTSTLKGPGDPEAKTLLVTEARKTLKRTDFVLPDSVDVRAVNISSKETFLSSDGQKLTLWLGAREVGEAEGHPLAPDFVYADWPCGAFGS